MFREEYFPGLTKLQLTILNDYYMNHHSHLSSHKSDWRKYYSYDPMMIEINLLFERQIYDHNHDFKQIDYINILNRDYIYASSFNSLALFDLETNASHVYSLTHWKNTGLRYWSNSNSGYLGNPSGEYLFSRWDSKDLIKLANHIEFKYIDFSKLKVANPYILLNERHNRQKLWQIEMLVKQGYYLLAQNLATSYQTIDFKVFKHYEDFFKKKGKGLKEYNEIISLRKNGFDDPEYIYLQRYLYSSFGNYFVKFLTEHPEINRNRFLKYIKNRKGKRTIFEVSFLYLYYEYLIEAAELELDLSKDKYAFPQDLEKAMEDHLLSINPYTYKNYKFRSIFEKWQSSLPKNKQSDIYISRIKAVQKEEKRRVLLAKKRSEEKQKFLEFLWNYNKQIKYEVNDLYILTAPTSSQDLIIEGKTLNHCVGSYVERISNKQTSIYFLRKKDYLNKPFYTIEIKNGKLQQCRTTNNQVNPEIMNTLMDWLTKTNIKIPSWDIESEIKHA